MKLRWFWRGYFALLTLIALGIPFCLFGPAVELAVAPVLPAQTISDITRETGTETFAGQSRPITRLCWRWQRVKRRPLGFVSTDMEVFIDAPHDTAAADIYNRETGARWARSGAVSPGPVDQWWCATLPPNVASGPVRIRQTAVYPGWLGLWSLAVRLPDVTDPPGATIR